MSYNEHMEMLHRTWVDLFLASLAYKRFKLFYYASITDCTAENILNPIWLRGKEFPQAKAAILILDLKTCRDWA